MTNSWEDTIQRIDENGVYRITLNRPAKRNAFSPRMYHEVKRGVLLAGVHSQIPSSSRDTRVPSRSAAIWQSS